MHPFVPPSLLRRLPLTPSSLLPSSLFSLNLTPSVLFDPQIPFSFNESNTKLAEEIISRYPSQYKKAAVIPLLDLGQRQNDNWTSLSVMNEVARILELAPMRVYEVATFYTMVSSGEVERMGWEEGGELKLTYRFASISSHRFSSIGSCFILCQLVSLRAYRTSLADNWLVFA